MKVCSRREIPGERGRQPPVRRREDRGLTPPARPLGTDSEAAAGAASLAATPLRKGEVPDGHRSRRRPGGPLGGAARAGHARDHRRPVRRVSGPGRGGPAPDRGATGTGAGHRSRDDRDGDARRGPELHREAGDSLAVRAFARLGGLPPAAPPRARRAGRRAHRPPGGAGPHGRRQANPARQAQRLGTAAVPPRGGHHRAVAAPRHRADLRPGTRRRRAVLHHAIHPRPDPAAGDRRLPRR